MIFNKFTTLVVALSFVFVSEAFAHRHGRHAGKHVCQKNERDSSHIARQTPRARHNCKNFHRDNKGYGRRHIRRHIPQEALSLKRQACMKKWAARKGNRQLGRSPRKTLSANRNAISPNSKISGRKHLKRNFSYRRNNPSRGRFQRTQRVGNV